MLLEKSFIISFTRNGKSLLGPENKGVRDYPQADTQSVISLQTAHSYGSYFIYLQTIFYWKYIKFFGLQTHSFLITAILS